MPSSSSSFAARRTLAANLAATLRVAGPADERGLPRRLRTSHLQRRTGSARSTARALMRAGDGESNPDLRTLCRIAEELRVPVAFLLMGSNEWRALLSAFADMRHTLEAAEGLDDRMLTEPHAALRILKVLKVHPATAPLAGVERQDEREKASLEVKNEERRIAILVTAALAQTAASNRKDSLNLTAFAAALANQLHTN